MTFPIPVSFPSSAHFSASAEFPGEVEVSVLDVTNAQKLSLSLNTPLATQVAVSDGFYLVAGSGSGLYTARGAQNGSPYYNAVGHPNDQSNFAVVKSEDPANWRITDGGSSSYYASSESEDVAFPWLATGWTAFSGDTPLPTLTHPALQQLAAASTAQGGVFVSGGTQDGVLTVTTEIVGGKTDFRLLGNTGTWNDGTLQGAFWNVGFTLGEAWVITDIDQNTIYYSLSDVATPDLASNWKNASDDSPASISVASVTQGQLGAGLFVAGATTFRVNGSSNGRDNYSDVASIQSDIAWSLGHNDWEQDGTTINSGNVAFPFLGTPEVTVDRDDVANEACWVPYP